MRQITVDFTSQTYPRFAGYLGEHNATELIAIKPIDLSGAMYSLAFMTNGEVIHSKYFFADEDIKVTLWQQLTQDNTLYVQLESYDENGEYLGKSTTAKLILSNSVHGTDMIADVDNPDVYSEIAQNSAFREVLEDNTDTLNKLTTSATGKLLFDGKLIEGSGGGSAYIDVNVVKDTSEEYTLEFVTDTETVTTPNLKGKEGKQGVSGVYVGTGEMPEGFNVQIDPDGEAVVIPTKTSELINDSGFITRAELPESGSGVDGFSPIVNVTEISNGHNVSITDATGTKIFAVLNGQDGKDGKDGVDGTNGIDGKDGKDGAKGDKGDKGDSYTLTETDKTEIADEVVTKINVSFDNIPEYWQTELDEGVEAINTALETAGYNKSAFLFYSDVHWNYGSQMSPKLLKYLYEHTGMTKTNFGGDIVNDEATDYDSMSYLWDWRKQLKNLPNHHSVVGNHDDGNTTNNLFSEQYIYGYLFAAEETSDITRGNNGFYYYIDNPAEKTRYLYLDTAYKGATTEQQTFVKDALMSTPEKWHIVAISHIWRDTIYNGANREVGEINANASVFLAMFDAYNARTGDYAECMGKVEFCIGGHTHLDHDSTSDTGIPIILVATDSQHTGGVRFEYGTTSEASVNGIIADYDNKKIYVVRIGRGENRTVVISSKVITYTNVLPKATDTSGNVYNGKGYKENTRWSTSGNAETTGDGVYITGYIPVSNKDVVYLKNVTMDKDINENGCRVLYFTELNGLPTIQNADNITKFCNGVWDENGLLKQFTVENVPYIRLQADYIGADSVITINEPID